MKGIIAIVALFITVGLAACQKEGLPESAGADKAIEKTADKLAPNAGPAETAGEKTDETVKKAQKDEKQPM